MKNSILAVSLTLMSVFSSCGKESHSENNVSETVSTAKNPTARKPKPVQVSQSETYPIWRIPFDALRVIWVSVGASAGWVIKNIVTQEEEPISIESAEQFNKCIEIAMEHCDKSTKTRIEHEICLDPRIQACYDQLHKANGLPLIKFKR
jgi:hypothetical protein